MHGIKSSALASRDEAPRYDDTAWPLFSIEMPPAHLSALRFEEHLGVCRALFERGERFALLIDMAEHPTLPASQRHAIAEAMQRDCSRHPDLCCGLALVVQSSFQRSIVQAIHAMSRPSYPLAIFATTVEARAWLANRKLSVPVPSRGTHELLPPPSVGSRSSRPPLSGPRSSRAPLSRASAPVDVSPGQRTVTRRPSSAER